MLPAVVGAVVSAVAATSRRCSERVREVVGLAATGWLTEQCGSVQLQQCCAAPPLSTGSTSTAYIRAHAMLPAVMGAVVRAVAPLQKPPLQRESARSGAGRDWLADGAVQLCVAAAVLRGAPPPKCREHQHCLH